MSSKAPRPPKDVRGSGGRALWRRVCARFDLDEREREILRLACLRVDAGEALEAAVAEAGRTVAGSKGQPRVHPAVGEARQEALAAGRLLAMLELPDEDGKVLTPAQRRARHAATVRWGVHEGRKERRGDAA